MKPNLTLAHIFQMGGTKTTKQLSECEKIAEFFVLPIRDTTIGTFARHQRFESCQRDEKVQSTLILGTSPVEQWKNPGWLGYIRDEKLPSYIGIEINHYCIRIPINQPV